MPQDQLLLTIVVIVILADVLLVARAHLRGRAQPRSWQKKRSNAGISSVRPASDSHLPDDEDARLAAAIEAFVADVSGIGAGATGHPEPAARFDSPETPAGLGDLTVWDRAVREESDRGARFGRPVTVVMAALPHIDDVANRLGPDAADRVIRGTAHVLLSQGRRADRVAWLGDATFGILLLETDEVRACTYVERARAAADSWLESAGLSIRLSLGWASPTRDGDAVAAAATARRRMLDAARVGGEAALVPRPTRPSHAG